VTYPADQTVRERILDNVESSIAAIAPPSYKMTLGADYVRRWNGSTFDTNSNQIAVVVPLGEEHSDGRIGLIEHTMNLLIVLGVRAQDWSTRLQDFISDVRLALTKDAAAWTRGGLALTTQVVSDRVFDSTGSDPVAEAHLNVRVLYRTVYDDPTTAR